MKILRSGLVVLGLWLACIAVVYAVAAVDDVTRPLVQSPQVGTYAVGSGVIIDTRTGRIAAKQFTDGSWIRPTDLIDEELPEPTPAKEPE